MADAYMPAANVPAGGRDDSDRFGPYIQGGGDNPAPLKGYPGYDTTSATYPPGPSSAGIEVPRAVFHDDQGGYVVHAEMTADSSNPPPVADRDGDAQLPDIPRYEGPAVSDANNALPAPMVNPSVGVQGPIESGLADVNPVGRVFSPGDTPPVDTAQVVPDTTQDVYPR